jgi:glycosyltransferase involved in cell wall biosynthesis
MQGVKPAADWMDLKKILSLHRFYIHTADPRFEDGFNMAMLEAMAAGLPVLGNRYPTSPIVNGVNGFLSDNTAELRGYALRLLADRDLALQLGMQAQETVRRKYSPHQFAEKFLSSLCSATAKWNGRLQT